MNKELQLQEDNETKEDVLNVPKPSVKEEKQVELFDFTGDDIIDLVCSTNKEGYSPAFISASIQKIHNVDENTMLEDVKEEDLEQVDDMVIENCKVDIFALNEKFINIRLEFDSVNDAYLRELNEILNRYRVMQEANLQDETSNTIPVFYLTFMPVALQGRGILKAVLPTAYFRTLNDNDINACMHFIFDIEGIEANQILLTEEEKINIEAEILREFENSANGQMFED